MSKLSQLVFLLGQLLIVPYKISYYGFGLARYYSKPDPEIYITISRIRQFKTPPPSG